MVSIIPTPDEFPENQIPENSETEILRERISGNSELVPTFPEVTEQINEDYEVVYSIDDLVDVWCRGATNGATLWQYCQETNKPLPVSFEAGLIELTNEVRNAKDKANALQQVLNNNMILLGVFEEKQ